MWDMAYVMRFGGIKKAEDKRQNLKAGIIQMYRLTRNGIRPVMAAA
jgi:hypothetical protein